MSVPVLWVSRHPEIRARGYKDQGFLESLFARRVWTPPNALTFTHHEVRGDFPEVEGAVVVLPARHHVEDVDWFKAQVDRLEWSLVILCGDEEWAFPWREIEETETRKVWVMQPEPGHERFSGRIPAGWYPGTDEFMHHPDSDPQRIRPLAWMFAGQVTHPRRFACAQVLHVLHEVTGLESSLILTNGYMHGLSQERYWSKMLDACVVPCPSGPCSVDTARTFEALEAGAIPVVDTIRPREPQFDYWSLLFGKHPLIGVQDWHEFPTALAGLLKDWTAKSNEVFAWWQGWKRDIALQLDSDDDITVLVTTSPIPSHPSTEIIEQTIESIRQRLPHAEILIAVDGVRPEQQDRKPDYDEYIRRLLWITNTRWHNVLPVLMPEWVHQARATQILLDKVSTPLILFVEHDTPLVGEIDFQVCADLILTGEVNLLRFHHFPGILDEHAHLFDPPARGGYRSTLAWWQRPHLAETEFYRDKLSIFAEDSRTMIEDVLYSLAINEQERDGFPSWGMAVYAPEGDMQRSIHLDGRGTDIKGDMVVSYSGDTPWGAPQPMKGRE